MVIGNLVLDLAQPCVVVNNSVVLLAKPIVVAMKSVVVLGWLRPFFPPVIVDEARSRMRAVEAVMGAARPCVGFTSTHRDSMERK